MRTFILAIGVLSTGLTGLGCSGAESSSDVTATVANALAAPPGLAPTTKFFIPPPAPGAVKQAARLLRTRKFSDALAVAALEATPSAVRFNSGTPAEVKRAVQKTYSTDAAPWPQTPRNQREPMCESQTVLPRRTPEIIS